MEFEDTNGDDVAPRKKETVLYGAEPLFNTQTQRWILAVARGFLGSQSISLGILPVFSQFPLFESFKNT
jgi:hypothetical protein